MSYYSALHADSQLIEIQSLVNDLYDEGNYDLVIDYTQPPVPALSEENWSWVNELLQIQGIKEG